MNLDNSKPIIHYTNENEIEEEQPITPRIVSSLVITDN